MINKQGDADSKEDSNKILKGNEPLLRKKRREIILMGENYEDVMKERKEVIVQFMNSVPKLSAQSKPNRQVYMEVHTPSSVE